MNLLRNGELAYGRGQLYVAGEPRNERDFLWRRLDAEQRRALTVPFERTGDGLRAALPIVAAG